MNDNLKMYFIGFIFYASGHIVKGIVDNVSSRETFIRVLYSFLYPIMMLGGPFIIIEAEDKEKS